mgnify:FL=1
MANISYANRGKDFEAIIDYVNELYERKGLATIHKIPVEHKAITRNGYTKAWYASKSTVDYIGVCNGRALAFDAKSTRGKSLPLANIPEHQIVFLTNWQRDGGQAFFLVEYTELNEVYRLPLYIVREQIEIANKGGRKSLAIEHCREVAVRVKKEGVCPLDYLGLM